MQPCNLARRTAWQNPDGSVYEGYWLGSQFIFENQIRNLASYTREHPGWVLADDGLCQWQGQPPARYWEQQPQTTAAAVVGTAPTMQANAAAIAPSGDVGGGALLLVVGLIGSAIYAAWQIKKGGDDFADDYHPMSDAPALPTVFTDENLDHIYQRYSYPQYQGITEPSPWQSTQVFPAVAPPPITAPSPVTTADTAVTGSVTGSGDNATTEILELEKQHFENEVLPAPRNGYELSENDRTTKGKAYWLIWQAVMLGYSKNWMCEYLFKIPKGGNGVKYRVLSDIVNRVKQELGQ